MLAVWEFFWTGADWTSTSQTLTAETGVFTLTGQDANLLATSTPAVTTTGAGSGKWRGHYPLDDDYWEIRERYIKRMFQVTEVRHASDTPQPIDSLPSQSNRSDVPLLPLDTQTDIAVAIDQLAQRQALALEAARNATTRTALKRAGARVAETSLQLNRLRDQYELETLAILIASTI